MRLDQELGSPNTIEFGSVTECLIKASTACLFSESLRVIDDDGGAAAAYIRNHMTE